MGSSFTGERCRITPPKEEEKIKARPMARPPTKGILVRLEDLKFSEKDAPATMHKACSSLKLK